ncbi:hypothetical protein [Halorubrum sp. AJ67]|uniref:hypothetical protein n=1 Tax=Halorubrum sp. AJ67 TaxID=1173487 RepID=UPI0003DBF425|nr:hypothetical protein [Halorubrum sp. AJ67]CDK39637.1 hypothetical protein BN903_36 [Halorubrum sp. AJ67]
MSDFFDNKIESGCKLVDQTLMLEFVEAVDKLDSHRDLLRMMVEDERQWFRLKLRNDVEENTLAELDSAGLIESRSNGGEEQPDFRATGRAQYLFDSIPEDGELDGVEVGALFVVAGDIWDIPGRQIEWAEQDLTVDVSDRGLRLLLDGGLIQLVSAGEAGSNQSDMWMSTRRLEQLQSLIYGFAQA